MVEADSERWNELDRLICDQYVALADPFPLYEVTLNSDSGATEGRSSESADEHQLELAPSIRHNQLRHRKLHYVRSGVRVLCLTSAKVQLNLLDPTSLWSWEITVHRGIAKRLLRVLRDLPITGISTEPKCYTRVPHARFAA